MSNFSAFLNGAGQLVTNDGDDFYAAMVSGRISLQLTLANGNYNGTATTSAAFSADFSADPDFNNEARDEIPNLDLASRTVVEPVAAAAIAGGVNNLLVFNNGPVSAFLTGVFNAQQNQINGTVSFVDAQLNGQVDIPVTLMALPPLVQIDSFTGHIGEKHGPATVTLSRSFDTSGTSTVQIQLSPGTASSPTNYGAATPALVTFNPGDTTAAVTIPINDDLIIEPNLDFEVRLVNPVNATLGLNTADITIVDEDQPAGFPPLPVGTLVIPAGVTTFTVPNPGQGTVLVVAAGTAARAVISYGSGNHITFAGPFTGGIGNLFHAGSGFDRFIAGSGNNAYVGGTGTASVEYSSAPGPVVIDVANGIAANGFGGFDQFSGIYQFVGSPKNDTFRGGPGNHSFDGAAGFDTLDYSAATTPVFFAFSTARAYNNLGGASVNVDQFANIEIFKGGSSNDTFIGGPGNHFLVGGGGLDTLDDSAATTAVYFALSTSLAYNNFGGAAVGVDQFSGITVFKGGSSSDVFIGGPGNHIFIGGGGLDTLDYSAATTGAFFALSTGLAYNNLGGAAVGVDQFFGIAVFKGGSSNDVFIGGPGNHFLVGGGGVDTLDYSAATTPVFFAPSTGLAYNNFGGATVGVDQFSGITVFKGGSSNDTFVGSIGSHTFIGGGGIDTLDFSANTAPVAFDVAHGLDDKLIQVTPQPVPSYILGGRDQFAGITVFKGGTDNDTFAGGPGNHAFFGDGGIDTLDYSAATTSATFDIGNGLAYNNFGGSAVGVDQFFGLAIFKGASNGGNTFFGSNTAKAGDPVSYAFMGGSGQDTFEFGGIGPSIKFGNAVIGNFQSSTDVIDLNHIQFGSYAAIQAVSHVVNGSEVITLDATDTITLLNVTTLPPSSVFHLL